MKFIKNGIIYEQPIYMLVDGMEIELTYAQLIGMGYSDYDAVMSSQENSYSQDSITFDKMQMFLDSIPTIAPEGSTISEDGSTVSGLPFELGKKWTAMYDGEKVSVFSIDDENAYGTETNPFMFPAEGDSEHSIKVMNGAFYIHEGSLFKYNGEVKVTNKWEDVSDDMVDPYAPVEGRLDIVLRYNVDAAGEKVLYYTGVQPKAAAGPYSTFPEGSYAEIYTEEGVLENTIDLYQPLMSEGTINYSFLGAGEYTVKIYNANNNANGRVQSGTDYDDTGMSVYPNLFRCGSWGVIDGTKTCLSGIDMLNLPSETTNIGQMFNGCKATGVCPDINLPEALRTTGLFNASQFSEIGNVYLPKANTTLTDQGEWSDGHQMFASNGNLVKVGNVTIGHLGYATQMFYGDGNLEEIGVLDCLKDVLKAENIFAGCTKLAQVSIKSLPTTAGVLIDLSACPINSASIAYMKDNVNNGLATIKFSATTKALENYSECSSALQAKGYTIQ